MGVKHISTVTVKRPHLSLPRAWMSRPAASSLTERMTTMFAKDMSRREMLALTGSLSVAALAFAGPPSLKSPVSENSEGETKRPAASRYAASVLALKPAGYWRLGEA